MKILYTLLRRTEIGIVRTDPHGRMIEEYETLVNPQRDVGPTPIHGIMAEDVVKAPIFKDIAGDIARRLVGTILVAHNLQFDYRFLNAELARCGVNAPSLPAICTLHLAFQLSPGLPSRKLKACCEEAGIPHTDEHRAISDARATTALIAIYIQRAATMGLVDLLSLGCENCVLPDPSWIDVLPLPVRPFPRSFVRQSLQQERSYLARLVQHLRADDATDPRSAEYMALLDRALEDRQISSQEANALVSAAEAWGISRNNVLATHRIYLSSLVSQALEDSVVTEVERRDLESVCEMLGLHYSTLNELLSSRQPLPTPTVVEENFSGKSVCFTGELSSSIGGVAITREKAEELAAAAGLTVKNGVTKKLDLLVCADSHTQSGKAKKAREYGIRIISEPAFWRAIKIKVE